MKTLTALTALGDSGLVLGAPKVGIFRPESSTGDFVRPGTRLGTLTILGRHFRVVAPAEATGQLRLIVPAAPTPVGYGTPLASVDVATLSVAEAKVEAKNLDAHAFVRSPIHGVFYVRPAPEAPPFVKSGDEITTGKAIGLVEVMKTFHPVTFDGARARVIDVLVSDRVEVARDQPLISLEPLAP
ncbi:MAG: hypothetical protein HY791_24180 [Deltaproteobacteria bacterium]|nr:hypothetical protein [Deltaproteobacteria bacterium]